MTYCVFCGRLQLYVNHIEMQSSIFPRFADPMLEHTVFVHVGASIFILPGCAVLFCIKISNDQEHTMHIVL